MLDHRQVVVVDTTPIISLALLQQLHLLQLLYGEVLIPPAVHAEIVVDGSRAGASELRTATYIQTVSLKDPQRAALLSDLNCGKVALGLVSP